MEELKQLREALKILEDYLGPTLIKAEVHKIESWNPEGAPNLHPQVLLWYKVKEELALAELTGTLPHSQRSVEVLRLAKSIQTGEGI
ncbi:hypothetical protein [Desulforamulus ferrireducens]|uniref:Uncharacterized protein n=1 Tax=Desulforamulus ferrireducens TaxID=1833852 RepID=A0A1S6IWF1_9FIRM|nr:hypothetical protein [Desulforamulus ferrireducens]AQS59111.1 hypothetical protein B0537_08475 [Desulforamulus ferrireducens]